MKTGPARDVSSVCPSHVRSTVAHSPSSPEKEPVTVTEFTLPNRPVNALEERSVMWHGPDPTGAGARSAVPKAGSHARGVTVGVNTPTGAALAREPHDPWQRQGAARTLPGKGGDDEPR